jgi:hypothetical protein
MFPSVSVWIDHLPQVVSASGSTNRNGTTIMMTKTLARVGVAAIMVATLSAGVLPAGAAQMMHSQAKQQTQHTNQFTRHGDYAVLNGHKGYKHKRAGYRYYNGYWFPPAAFIIANIIHNLIPHR